MVLARRQAVPLVECRLTDCRSDNLNASRVVIHRSANKDHLSNIPKTRTMFQRWIWLNMDLPSHTCRIQSLKSVHLQAELRDPRPLEGGGAQGHRPALPSSAEETHGVFGVGARQHGEQRQRVALGLHRADNNTSRWTWWRSPPKTCR